MVSFCLLFIFYILLDINYIIIVVKKVCEFCMKWVIGKNDDRRKIEVEKKKLEIKKKEKELVCEVFVCFVFL